MLRTRDGREFKVPDIDEWLLPRKQISGIEAQLGYILAVEEKYVNYCLILTHYFRDNQTPIKTIDELRTLEKVVDVEERLIFRSNNEKLFESWLADLFEFVKYPVFPGLVKTASGYNKAGAYMPFIVETIKDHEKAIKQALSYKLFPVGTWVLAELDTRRLVVNIYSEQDGEALIIERSIDKIRAIGGKSNFVSLFYHKD